MASEAQGLGTKQNWQIRDAWRLSVRHDTGEIVDITNRPTVFFGQDVGFTYIPDDTKHDAERRLLEHVIGPPADYADPAAQLEGDQAIADRLNEQDQPGADGAAFRAAGERAWRRFGVASSLAPNREYRGYQRQAAYAVHRCPARPRRRALPGQGLPRPALIRSASSCDPAEAWACRERACYAKEVQDRLAEGSEGCPKGR
jgi:hypothetical protein